MCNSIFPKNYTIKFKFRYFCRDCYRQLEATEQKKLQKKEEEAREQEKKEKEEKEEMERAMVEYLRKKKSTESSPAPFGSSRDREYNFSINYNEFK
jgi:hypothetical protein